MTTNFNQKTIINDFLHKGDLTIPFAILIFLSILGLVATDLLVERYYDGMWTEDNKMKYGKKISLKWLGLIIFFTYLLVAALLLMFYRNVVSRPQTTKT